MTQPALKASEGPPVLSLKAHPFAAWQGTAFKGY